MLIIYPEVDVKFDAEVDIGLYLNNYNPYIHAIIKSGLMGKGKVNHSIELDNPIVVLDYDKDENLIGIEIIGDAKLGDLKE